MYAHTGVHYRTPLDRPLKGDFTPLFPIRTFHAPHRNTSHPFKTIYLLINQLKYHTLMIVVLKTGLSRFGKRLSL